MSEKTGTDGAQLLSNLSGMPRDKVLEIWEEVKINSAKLKNCIRHRFEQQSVKLGDKITCVNCGGVMSLSSAGEYVRGYKASGGDSDDVWPGFFKDKG